MKQQKEYIFKLLMGIIGLTLLIGLVYQGFNSELNGNEIDCYDKDSNKIIGLKCINGSSFDTREESITICFVCGIFAFLLSIKVGDIMDKSSNGNIL